MHDLIPYLLFSLYPNCSSSKCGPGRSSGPSPEARHGVLVIPEPRKTSWAAIEAVKAVKGQEGCSTTELAAAWCMNQQQKPGPGSKPGPLSTCGKVGQPHTTL